MVDSVYSKHSFKKAYQNQTPLLSANLELMDQDSVDVNSITISMLFISPDPWIAPSHNPIDYKLQPCWLPYSITIEMQFMTRLV